MQPRTDALPFSQEAAVDPSLCVSCGICAGACPTSTPFRRASDLVPGIDLPDRSLVALRAELERKTQAPAGEVRVVVFGCDKGIATSGLEAQGIVALSLPCIAALPPSFIDFVLSRGLADGVFLTGCREGECFHRFGVAWTEDRLARRRDPYLRNRVPRERIEKFWAASPDRRQLDKAIVAFAARLKALPHRGGTVAAGAAIAQVAQQRAPNHG